MADSPSSAESVATCECLVTPESEWLSAASCGYGSGYEPGSQMEWNPDCPVHTQAVPGVCAECGKDPATGFASVWTVSSGEVWLCHGDDDEEPTCYQRANHAPRVTPPGEVTE